MRPRRCAVRHSPWPAARARLETGGAVIAITCGAAVEAIPWSRLRIASDRCKGCELCVAACTPGVLALDPAVVNRLGYHPVRLLDAAGCTSCARCARVCPDVVFTIYAAPRAIASREPDG